jgi:catechol 2,3-dioxygenase
MTLLDSAAFVAAGGYHHHLGFNIWRGQGAPPVPAGTVGLRHWTIVLPAEDAAALRERVVAAGVEHEERPEGLLVRDPWGIALLVCSEG